MKNKFILLASVCALMLLNACKKDAKTAQVPANNPSVTQPTNLSDAITGKWFVVKDSIQTSDYDTVLPTMRNVLFTNADFVTFNGDNTGKISSQVAYNALYTNFPTQFVNSIDPGQPNMNFNYQVTTIDNTLHIPNINQNIGIAYKMTPLSATTMLLFTQATIVQIPHSYTFKQYIYLSK